MITVKDTTISNSEKRLEVSRLLGIPSDLVVMMGDRPYIEKAGLLLIAHRRKKNYIEYIQTEPIKNSYETNNEYALFKARIKIEGIKEPYISYGSASKKSVKMSTLHGHLDHIAETRAINRCLRLITANGYYTPEEMAEVEHIEEENDIIEIEAEEQGGNYDD